jgi:hypothetical protein
VLKVLNTNEKSKFNTNEIIHVIPNNKQTRNTEIARCKIRVVKSKLEASNTEKKS